jgi:hypothetical protein
LTKRSQFPLAREVEPLLAFPAQLHQAGLAKHPEVLGDSAHRQVAEGIAYLAYGARFAPHQPQDFLTPWST